MRKASPLTFVCSLPVRRCYGHGYGFLLSGMASGGEGMGCEGVLKAVSATKRPSMRPTSAKMSKRGVKAAESGASPAGHIAAE